MKRILCHIIGIIFLFSLTGCGGKVNIVGIWEQEMKTSILGEGIEKEVSVSSLRRFTFREDGTGIQEHIMLDGSYPDAVREFTWQLEVDTLILDYGGGYTEEFTALLNKTTLKLENSRGKYDLMRSE